MENDKALNGTQKRKVQLLCRYQRHAYRQNHHDIISYEWQYITATVRTIMSMILCMTMQEESVTACKKSKIANRNIMNFS